jgi:hypothetical protein
VLCGECGTEFEMEANRRETDPMRAATNRMMTGALLCVGGLAITILSFVSAVNSPSGGVWVMTGGAIVFGAKRFLQGYFEVWSGSRKTKPSREDNRDFELGIERATRKE